MIDTSIKIVQSIAKGLDAIWTPSAVHEVRTIDPRTHHIQSGYFDDFAEALQAITALDGTTQIYITINPLNPHLIERSNNTITRLKETSKDLDVSRRAKLYIDLDPVRDANMPTTDAEHHAALARAHDIAAFLKSQGWPEPMIASSGNGAAMLWNIDLQNNEATRSLVNKCLLALAARFNDESVKVDTSVSNASRIMKVPGVMSVKGDSSPERPHRRSRVILCGSTAVVPESALLALADSYEESRDKAPQSTSHDLGPWMRERDGRNNALASYLGRIRRYNADFDSVVMMTIARNWNRRNCKHLLDEAELGATVKSIMKYPSERTAAPLPRDCGLTLTHPKPSAPNAPIAQGSPSAQAPIWEDTAPYPTLRDDALFGIAGDWVRALAPHTEADPAALMFQFLTAAMSMVGAGPHVRIGASLHYARLFAVIVGSTAKARKGQSYKEAMALLKAVDPALLERSRMSGLASGEALVAVLSDKYDKDGNITEAAERRIVVHETEFARCCRLRESA